MQYNNLMGKPNMQKTDAKARGKIPAFSWAPTFANK